MPRLLADPKVIPGLVPAGPARQDVPQPAVRHVVMTEIHLAQGLGQQVPASPVIDRTHDPP